MIDNTWERWDKLIPTASQLDRMPTAWLMSGLKEIERQLEIMTAMKNNEDWIPNITRETLFKDMEETEKILLEILWKANSETLQGVLSRLSTMKELYKGELDRRNGV